MTRAISLTLAAGVLLPLHLQAQEVVYDNSSTSLTWWAQVLSGAPDGPEGGDQITLGGAGRIIQQFEFWYRVGGLSAAGEANIQVRFYANDGPGGAPGTVLWTAATLEGMPHISGNNHVAIAVPSLAAPETFTWTVEFTGRAGSTAHELGLRIDDPPLIGSSDPGFMWVRNSSGTFLPAAFPGAVPSNFAARISAAGAPAIGACCFGNQTCIAMSIIDCHAVSGVFIGGTCSPCPPAAACCFVDGWCLQITSTGCDVAGGAWTGAGIGCAAACEAPLFTNGPLATGKTRSDLLHAPYDTYWSDIIRVGTCETHYIGYNASATTGFRHADNFVIDGPNAWQLQEVQVYAFMPGGSINISPVQSATLRIWDGPPGAPGATIVWGDSVVNRLRSTQFARIYKYSTAYPIFRIVLDADVVLPPGEYWVDYALAGTGNSAVYAPFVTLANLLGKTGGDALYSADFGETWLPVLDEPLPTATCAAVPQDFPFAIIGAELVPECYANCDGSTIEPALNVDDFTCFLNAYALGLALPAAQQVSHYANCDASTAPPVLNVDDFTCFLNRYALGCP
jgi:hypothetical protein